MAKTAQEVEKVVGIVLRAFPARKAGKYTVYDFVLRTPTGDLKVSRFGSGVQEHVGENVSFDATYNEQYDRYTVQGDIAGLDAPVEQTEPQAIEAPKAKRGRPVSVSTPNSVKTVNESANVHVDSHSREAYRAEAVQGVALNLNSAREVAEQLGLKVTGVQDLIALADIIGRTQTSIYLQAEKRN